MTTASTRRAFLKTGALFAVPLAAPAVAAIRQRVDDETAIRAAHEAWLRDVNRGAVALMASERSGEVGPPGMPPAKMSTFPPSAKDAMSSVIEVKLMTQPGSAVRVR